MVFLPRLPVSPHRTLTSKLRNSQNENGTPFWETGTEGQDALEQRGLALSSLSSLPFEGIVNLTNSLDEFPALNLHLRALRGHFFEEMLGWRPTFIRNLMSLPLQLLLS
jgi:hypothetical protein